MRPQWLKVTLQLVKNDIGWKGNHDAMEEKMFCINVVLSSISDVVGCHSHLRTV